MLTEQTFSQKHPLLRVIASAQRQLHISKQSTNRYVAHLPLPIPPALIHKPLSLSSLRAGVSPQVRSNPQTESRKALQNLTRWIATSCVALLAMTKARVIASAQRQLHISKQSTDQCVAHLPLPIPPALIPTKLAVILHLYYEDQLPEIIHHLNNLKKANIPYDLFITTPNATKTHSLYASLPPRRMSAPHSSLPPRGCQLFTSLPPGGGGCRVRGKQKCKIFSPSPVLSLRGERNAKSNFPLKPSSDRLAEWLSPVRKVPPASHFTSLQVPLALIPTKNRGYDIAPFLETLHRLDLSRYDYVLKLHTKNQKKNAYAYINHRRLTNKIWSKMMWNALLGTPQKIRKNLQLLENDKKIGMLAAKYCLTNEPEHYQKALPRINKELATLGFPATEKLTFAAGTMFLARTEVLKPLLKYRLEDFPPTDGKVKEGTLAHVVERLFGAVTEAQGYRIAGTNHKTYPISRTLAAMKRFFYQKKQTANGNTLIKICKIPICRLPASP